MVAQVHTTDASSEQCELSERRQEMGRAEWLLLEDIVHRAQAAHATLLLAGCYTALPCYRHMLLPCDAAAVMLHCAVRAQTHAAAMRPLTRAACLLNNAHRLVVMPIAHVAASVRIYTLTSYSRA